MVCWMTTEFGDGIVWLFSFFSSTVALFCNSGSPSPPLCFCPVWACITFFQLPSNIVYVCIYVYYNHIAHERQNPIEAGFNFDMQVATCMNELL